MLTGKILNRKRFNKKNYLIYLREIKIEELFIRGLIYSLPLNHV